MYFTLSQIKLIFLAIFVGHVGWLLLYLRARSELRAAQAEVAWLRKEIHHGRH